MYRLRNASIAALMIAAFSVAVRQSHAQPPGGGRGPGGRGFGMLPGGPAGSLSLATNPAVQEELKLKDAQKTKIQSLVEMVNRRQQELREQMRPPGQQGQNQQGRRNRNNGNANGQGGNGGQNNNAAGGGFGGGPGGGFGGGPGGGFGGGPGGWGGWGMGLGGWGGLGGLGWGGWGMGPGGPGRNGPGGNGPGGNGPGGNGPGGRGNRGQMDPQMAERFAQMREAMTELQQGSEQSLARILDRGQYSRLKQIQLQAEGLSALLRPDMVEKLNLGEDQVEQIQGLINEGRQAQRENGRSWGEMVRSAFPAPNPPDNGQNGGNAQNGNNGRRGPNRPNFQDPAFRETMQRFMERPETKAKMEEMRAQNERIVNRVTKAVYRVLTKRQAAAYKKMLGAPFDLSRLTGGPGQGPGNRGRTGNPANGTDTAQASGAEGQDAATAKPAPKSNGSSTTKARRKSLRELRGLDQ